MYNDYDDYNEDSRGIRVTVAQGMTIPEFAVIQNSSITVVTNYHGRKFR